MELKAPTGTTVTLNQSLATTDSPSFANVTCAGNVTTASSTGLSLYHPGGAGTYGPSRLTVVNAINKNGLVLDTTGGTYALTDIVSRVSASLSLNQRYETRVGYINAANSSYGEYQVLLNSSGSTAATFGTAASSIPGALTTGPVTCAGTFTANGACTMNAGVSVTGTLSVGSGSISCQNGVSCSSLTTPYVIFPSGTLSYYEEYVHNTTFYGPVTTASVRCTVVQIGKLVTLHVGLNTAGTTVTTLQTNLTMTTPIPTRFRPAGAVTTIVQGFNNGAGPVYFYVYQDMSSLYINMGGTAYYTANFNISPFSLTWSLV